MPSDPNDELARARARRERSRPPATSDADDAPARSAEQDEAIARARESWLLSQLGRDETAQPEPDEDLSGEAPPNA